MDQFTKPTPVKVFSNCEDATKDKEQTDTHCDYKKDTVIPCDFCPRLITYYHISKLLQECNVKTDNKTN